MCLNPKFGGDTPKTHLDRRMTIGLIAGLIFGRTGYYAALSWCCLSIFVFMVKTVALRQIWGRFLALGGGVKSVNFFPPAPDQDFAAEAPGGGGGRRGFGSGGEVPPAHVPDRGHRSRAAALHVLVDVSSVAVTFRGGTHTKRHSQLTPPPHPKIPPDPQILPPICARPLQ